MIDGHLRVGAAQREHAIELLRNAAADDRITHDELDDRVIVGQRPTYILVPDGWAVDAPHMRTTAWSGFVGMNVRTRPRRGYPRLLVRGTGMVVARASTPHDIKKSDKHLAKGRPALPPPAT